MFSLPTIIGLLCLYMGFLFVIALGVERAAVSGRNFGDNPVIYSLSLAIYLTAWTFYGSVGKAASLGVLFITFYVGPTLTICLWWLVLRKMVRIKNRYMVTSIADFISLRYDKSASIAALVSLTAIFSIVPYLSLQLKAISATCRIITQSPGVVDIGVRLDIGLLISLLLIVFIIILGVRKAVPTERHQGMVVAMAAESIVKLVAFLAVGIFVAYYMFGGVGDIFEQFTRNPPSLSLIQSQTDPSFYVTWLTYLVLSMSAIMFLPRQFHMAVVENFRESHIRTAMWLFPLYMFLITIFVLPIALGGLLSGYPVSDADTFVLKLPLSAGRPYLSLLVFLGGFASASGMIIICSMTISTMFTNHLLLPVVQVVGRLDFLKRYLLQCRWAAVAGLILASLWFERNVAEYFTLVDIGVISFAGILQFAPAMLGGIFWTRGNRVGALLGIGAGSAIWFYTLILPAFSTGGLISTSFLERGPWSISLLRPEHLFGLQGLDPVSHAVVWTMFFNIGLYILGSICTEQSHEERSLAQEFVSSLEAGSMPHLRTSKPTIDSAAKRQKINRFFSQYFADAKATQLSGQCFAALDIENREFISIVELAELYSEVEKHLASSTGAAAAHSAIRGSDIIAPSEENALKTVYADIIAQLKLTPSDLKRKIDYYREKERLLTGQASELERRIEEREKEIVERKRAEEALMNSERRLNDIINFLPDATFVIDLEGKILLWNRTAEEMTGFKADVMLGKGNYEYAIPFYGKRRPILIDLVLDYSEEIEKMYPHVRREGDIIIGENVTRSARRGEGYMFGMAAPLYDSEGRKVGAIESVRDITDRKQAEEELERHRDHLEELIKKRTSQLISAKEQAEAANRAKSAFLAVMSHELRTPLNAILGYAQILRKDKTLSGRLAEGLNTIHESGEHLLNLINDILDLSRIEAGKLELHYSVVGLGPFLRAIQDIMRIKADQKGVGFRCEMPPDLPKAVLMDEHRVRQVLLNLLGNAVKFTNTGEVVLRIQVSSASGSEKSSPQGCACLHFEVRDTGIGVSEEQLTRIFRPFEQAAGTEYRESGVGLGLAITRQLLRIMGSEAYVRSELGRGSLFWFDLDLPVAAVETSEAAPDRTISGYEGPLRKVLVVDDIAGNRALLVDVLGSSGFRVIEAQGAEEALVLVESDRPDLILMDVMMPEMDGLEATRRIRRMENGGNVPVIAISASTSFEHREKSLDAGADCFIGKPIDLEDLLKQIGTLLRLSWVYFRPESASASVPVDSKPIKLPPAEEMSILHRMALEGSMRDIRMRAEILAALGEEYAPFAHKLRNLAERFESQAIVAFMEKYVNTDRRGHGH